MRNAGTLRRNIVLLAAAAALGTAPLLLPVTGGMDEPFKGADNQATDAVTTLAPGYEPWAEPFWQPPSASIESLLFALQAAIGAGLIGYYIGLRRGQRTGPGKRAGGGDARAGD